MKTVCVLISVFLLSITSNANNPKIEQSEIHVKQNMELKNLITNLFDNQSGLVQEKNQKVKIVIMNSDYRKVRVDEVESMKEINLESTLLPVIYRSVFVTKIHNVAYYMLKE